MALLLMVVAVTTCLATWVQLCSGLKCERTGLGGPQVDVACVFPFIFQGVSYDECTDVEETSGKLWCSTMVDGLHHHVAGQGMWGYCDCDKVVNNGDSTGVFPLLPPLPEESSSGTWLPSAESGECGTSTAKTWILTGEAAKAGEYMFIALIGHTDSQTPFDHQMTFGCAGTLINRWYVLTSSACAQDHVDKDGRRMKLAQVVLGVRDLAAGLDTTDQGPTTQRFNVSMLDVTFYPENSTDYMEGGAPALIRLKKGPAHTLHDNETVHVVLACLPLPEETAFLEQSNLRVAGWDLAGPLVFPEMRHERVRPDPDPEDPAALIDWLRTLTAPKEAGAGHGEEEGAENEIHAIRKYEETFETICSPDFGGPLISNAMTSHYGRRMFAIGIFASEISAECSLDDAGVKKYARIEHYLPWIKANLKT